MKLSEMTNKDAFKAIATILPIAKGVVKDKELQGIWYRKLDLVPGMTEQEVKQAKGSYAAEKILDLIPYIIEHHEGAVYKILAILNGKTPKEIESQSFIETIGQLSEVLGDEDLIRLFTM